MKKAGILLFLASALLLAGCPNKTPSSPNSAIVWNPWNNAANPGEAANGSNGFLLQPYPGTSLSSVVLWMIVSQTGSYTFSLSAVDSTKNASIATASSGAVSITANSLYYPVTFAFGGNPGVTKGDQVSFTVGTTANPGGTASFCTQASTTGNTNIVETVGGSPQATGVAVVVYGNS